jgi:pimeloyl-ACP methyl ester carboxylesterase
MSKFSKVTIVLLAFFVVEAPLSHAQDRYAAFIHGFSFGDSRPEGVRDGERCEPRGAVYELDTPFRQGACNNAWEKAGSRWEASGTPDRWTGGPVDGYIKLKYFDRDLYRGTPGGPRDVTLDDTRRKMMERFVKTMKHKMQENNSPNAKWVLVGHSQGGIVARLLHEHIRKNVDEVDVEGVLSIASPMQGGKPSQVSYGSRSGYTNVKPIVDGFLKDVLVGPVGDAGGSLLNFIVPGLGTVFDIVANFWDPATYAANGVIDVIEGKLQALNEMAVAKEAKEAIGPDGELIQTINRVPDPDAYRALSGAERSPVPARIASGRRIEKDKVVTFGFWGAFGVGALGTTSLPNLGLVVDIFRGNDQVSPGEEPVTVDFFYDVKDAYANAADYYRYRCYGTLGLSCLGGDYRKWKRWKQGREAIQNFGSTYGEIVNAFRTEKKTRTRYVCDSPTMKSASGGKKGAFDPPSAAEYAHPRIDEDRDCRYVSETYYTSVPNKNDGLLGTATNTWNPPRARGSGPNLGSHSILYNDRPSSDQYKQGGTGYNHAEMVYNRRRYSSSEDPGISDGEFGKGQPNPPMQEGRRFLREEIFQ